MLSIDKNSFKRDYNNKFVQLHGKELKEGSNQQKYEALGSLVRDYVISTWMDTNKRYNQTGQKQVYYFSMEFLLGRLLGDFLLNLGIRDICREALSELGIELEEIESLEHDQGLGNGGLGRLAACFLDSMASLNIAGHGCGIRYKYGFFEQKIVDCQQVEASDNWLREGNVWEIKKQDKAEIVKFGGSIISDYVNGKLTFTHVNYEPVLAVPYDTPIVGYENEAVNTLRLWSAEPVSNEFDFSSFSRGEFLKAISYKNSVEAISLVLYPEDSFYEGKMLRLKQQYFFVSAGIQSIVRHYKKHNGDINLLDEKIAIHINDTHPTMVIPELIRLMVERGLEMDDAIEAVTRTCAYTNHTILAEALEKWPISYLKKVVPQLIPIIEVLDDKVRRKYDDGSVYIIDREERVHMAHIDIHYSSSVNGVASLHTDILKNVELNNFYKIYPEKFNNKTNGITFRRWLIHSNPQLTELITSLIGDGFKKDATELEKLLDYKDNEEVLNKILSIKNTKKAELKNALMERQNVEINENSIFDIQIKRLHEYKRQQLNALYIIHKYLEIKAGKKPTTPITVIFGAKAAPAYIIAQDIIHLILCLQELINNDPEVSPYLKVVMVENYNVTWAEKLIPACDISEQISLASKEASGTGNMKFMLNGAVTLGTEDGANVEIHDFVGDDNIYIFGDLSETVVERYANGSYCAAQYYNNNPVIKEAVDFITGSELMSIGDKERLERLSNELIGKDWFMTFPDFDAYVKTREQAYTDYENRHDWAKKMLVNIAKAGYFSSDRTIEEYNRDIWKLEQ